MKKNNWKQLTPEGVEWVRMRLVKEVWFLDKIYFYDMENEPIGYFPMTEDQIVEYNKSMFNAF